MYATLQARKNAPWRNGKAVHVHIHARISSLTATSYESPPDHFHLLALLILAQLDLEDILAPSILQQLQYRPEVLIRDDCVLGPNFGVPRFCVPVDLELLDGFF
jgi:hypothetical protein